jgi:choline dehydrogenase-like flavoprotein
MVLLRVVEPQPGDVDLTTVYDAIVVGSGAAGGMAVHALTARGLSVLMLEAGKQLDLDSELKSLEWPFEHPRRGRMPPDRHALSFNEYSIRQSPYAGNSPYAKVHSYVQGWSGSDYSKNIVVDEKEHPYTGTRYAWVRARCLGGKSNIWGRLALRLSDFDFKARSRDGWGDDWPISYADLAPYYDRVDRYLGISGVRENLPHLPDSLYQRPTRLNPAEVKLRESMARSGRVLTPYRAGVTTDGLEHNKYRSKCWGRGSCGRRAGGCDIHAAFDSPTGFIFPALDTGRLTVRTRSIVHRVTVDPRTGKAGGVAFLDAESLQPLVARARVVVLAASTLESARILLLSRSDQHPNGIANSSGHVGHNFCEHVMGPGATGFVKDLAGRARTLDDGRPGGFYIARFRNLEERHPKFIRGYGFEGSSGTTMVPWASMSAKGFGAGYKQKVRDEAGAFIEIGGFGEVLARYESHVDLDPEIEDRWGIPVLRFHYRFGDNEKAMCADMTETAQEMLEDAGIEVVAREEEMLTEGWSIHELGTARMGDDPRTSVLNQFQQSHDVRNLFVVDGSSHVSASCQNPTWTIMALAWRSCDHLADELARGNL